VALIYLCGITGVGKSTIGRELAQLLEYEFADTDEEMSQRRG
jgi:shikimate kinase